MIIKKNPFFLKNLKNIVIFGWSPNLGKIEVINKNLGIKTFIISSNSQKKLFIDINKVNFFENIKRSDIKNFIKKTVKVDQTLFLSISSYFIFNKSFINFLQGNLVNYFPSRLPFDKGRGGFSWHILRNDKILNNSFHLINDQINTGDVIISEKKIFPSYCKTPEDYEKFKWESFEIFYSYFIKNLKNKKKFYTFSQSNYIGNTNHALNTRLHGFIDWSMSSSQLYSFINAFDEPFVGAGTFLQNNKKVYLKSVHLHGGERTNHPFMSGLVIRHDKDWIVVATKDNYCILVEKVLDIKGKNIISFIKEGDRFITPVKYLEEAKKIIINYR